MVRDANVLRRNISSHSGHFQDQEHSMISYAFMQIGTEDDDNCLISNSTAAVLLATRNSNLGVEQDSLVNLNLSSLINLSINGIVSTQ